MIPKNHTLKFKSVDISNATSNEINKIISLYNQLPNNPKIKTKDQIEEIVYREHVIFIHLQDYSEPVGFMSYQKMNRTKTMFLHLFVIDEKFRNQKIGSNSIKKLKIDNDNYKITLLSSIKNIEAHKFYEKNNFRYTYDMKGRLGMCKHYVLE